MDKRDNRFGKDNRPSGNRDNRPVRDNRSFKDNRDNKPNPVNAENPQESPELREDIIAGRNPIREAMRAGKHIDKLLAPKGEVGPGMRELIYECTEKGIPIQYVDRRKLDSMAPNNQGVIAMIAAHEYVEVDDILAKAAEKGEQPLLIIADGIMDPYNLGAIIRTAECAGAHGVIIPKRRAVGITWAVAKASAGAVEHLPVARVVNISNTIEDLKKRGIWIAAADIEGKPYFKADLKGALAVVIGGEGEGIGRLVKEKCDFTVSIPMQGQTESLNASVASAILIYEAVRQRNNGE